MKICFSDTPIYNTLKIRDNFAKILRHEFSKYEPFDPKLLHLHSSPVRVPDTNQFKKKQ